MLRGGAEAPIIQDVLLEMLIKRHRGLRRLQAVGRAAEAS